MNLNRGMYKIIPESVIFSIRFLIEVIDQGLATPGARNTSGPRVIFARHTILHWIKITLHYNWFTAGRIIEIEITVQIHCWFLQEIYIAKRKMKTSWLMRNWWYPYLEVLLLVNNFFSKRKYTSHLKNKVAWRPPGWYFVAVIYKYFTWYREFMTQ